MPAAPSTDRQIAQWFDRRGLSLLLRGTGIGGDTSARSTPALIALLLLVMLVVVPLSTEATFGTGLLVSVGVLVGSWVVGNLARRRAPFAPVQRIGWIEGTAFVLGPVIAMGLAPYNDLDVDGESLSGAGARWVTMAGIAVGQLVLLGVVLTVVTLGLASLSAFLGRSLLQSLTTTGSALAATLPVLLGVVFFFFLNPGVWVTIGRLPPVPYTTVVVLLLLLAGAFLGSRNQLDIEQLTTFADTPALHEALADTPLADVDAATDPMMHLDGPTQCPLGRRQALTVRLVAIISRLVVALVVAGAIFVFFLVLGYLVVDADTVKGWTRTDPTPVLQVTTSVRAYLLSLEHLRVAGFLATFAAFNYSLASATDARLRDGAGGAAAALIRPATALRLVLLRRSGPAEQPPD